MPFLKFAMIVIGLVLAFAPISIYIMLKWGGDFSCARKRVQKQYPSLFHRNADDNQS